MGNYIPNLVLHVATPNGSRAQLTWVMTISEVSLPGKGGFLSQQQPGSVMAAQTSSPFAIHECHQDACPGVHLVPPGLL